ncbi:MAG TPA: hypothetical protein VNT75_26645 [Symbiobacteriaceae bacterium]|nr:hypothetical protein [Symbiobacteriaceae bacterium]
MAKRLTLVAAVVMVGIIALGCAKKAPAPPAEPVHVPVINQKETVTAPAPAPEAKSQPPAPVQPEAKRTYPDPGPALNYPSGPPAVAKPAEFIPWVEQAGWNLKAVQALFPAPEGTYKDGSGEEPNWTSYAYDGGALRLFAGGDGLFAVVVDTRRPGYQAFRDLKSAPGYQVEQLATYVVVMKLADAATQKKADALRGSEKVNLTASAPVIGKPSFSLHYHGVGSYGHYYVPTGLYFMAYQETEAQATKDSAQKVRKDVASWLVVDAAAFSEAPPLGRTAPGGKWWAGRLDRGGYWNNWIVVRTAGKAEQRYQAKYFIQDFHWLDDHRIVYGESPMGWNDALVVIDVNTRTTQKVEAPGRNEFGVAGPGKIWFTDTKGARHEVAVP